MNENFCAGTMGMISGLSPTDVSTLVFGGAGDSIFMKERNFERITELTCNSANRVLILQEKEMSWYRYASIKGNCSSSQVITG